MFQRTLVFAFALVASARADNAEIRVAPLVPPPLRLLVAPAVQAEVKLTDKQKESFAALAASWELSADSLRHRALGWRHGTDGIAEVEARTREFWKNDLTEAQAIRLRQIHFQVTERQLGEHGAVAAAGRQLGLRPDQDDEVTELKFARVDEVAKLVTSGDRYATVRTKVTAANSDTYEKMAEMLTRTQRERLKNLRGPVLDKAFQIESVERKSNPRYPPALFGRYDLELRYLTEPAIRRELKVTEEQSKELDTESKSFERDLNHNNGFSFVHLGSLPNFNDWTSRVLSESLNPAQRERLGQIMMQRRARAGPEAMCGHPDAVKALKLTQVQSNKLSEGQSVAEVLTRDQLAAREGLLGKPFEMPPGIDDPILPLNEAPIAWLPDVAARKFLWIGRQLRLTEDQIRRLKELADEEPKMRELIDSELGYSFAQSVGRAQGNRSAANEVQSKYKDVVEAQCQKVLDEKQRSLARQILGGLAKP